MLTHIDHMLSLYGYCLCRYISSFLALDRWDVEILIVGGHQTSLLKQPVLNRTNLSNVLLTSIVHHQRSRPLYKSEEENEDCYKGLQFFAMMKKGVWL